MPAAPVGRTKPARGAAPTRRLPVLQGGGPCEPADRGVREGRGGREAPLCLPPPIPRMPPPRSSLRPSGGQGSAQAWEGGGEARVRPPRPPQTTLGGRFRRAQDPTSSGRHDTGPPGTWGRQGSHKDLPPTEGTVSRTRGGPLRKNQGPQGLPSTYYRRPPPPGGGHQGPTRPPNKSPPGGSLGQGLREMGNWGAPFGGDVSWSRSQGTQKPYRVG